MNSWILSITFIAQLTILYFLSRINIQHLFDFLRVIFRKDRVVFAMIALLFLPGTIIHELSHFLMAMILLLKVREINIFPRVEKGFIKLGSVIYEKRDVVRSVLVGIAPIIVGVLFFWWFSRIDIMSVEGFMLKSLAVYIIFILSTTMFSSKQDLVDIVYVIPILMVCTIIFYFFPVDISLITKQKIIIEALGKFLYDVNIYLFISIAIHGILFLLFYIPLKLLKKSYG